MRLEQREPIEYGKERMIMAKLAGKSRPAAGQPAWEAGELRLAALRLGVPEFVVRLAGPFRWKSARMRERTVHRCD